LDKAARASLNSIITTYAFGLPSKKCIDQFNKINPQGALRENPLVKRKDGLLCGGDFANPFSINYDMLLEAIDEFRLLGYIRTATILEQNYAYLMNFEQAPIKEKYSFDEKEWSTSFKEQVLSNFRDRK
jgi:hypothetical protein